MYAPSNYLSDARAIPSLLQKTIFKPDCLLPRRVSNIRQLNNATNQRVEVFVTVALHVYIANFCILGMFVIIRNLAALVLFGSSVIDKFVKSIFPTEKKIVPFT